MFSPVKSTLRKGYTASPRLHSAACRLERLAKEEDVQHLQGDVSEPFVPDQTLKIQQGLSAKVYFLISCRVLLGHEIKK